MYTGKSYQVYKSASIESASPGKITLLLFDTALDCLDKAEKALKSNFTTKNQEIIHNNLTKAQAIFAELQSCLDFRPAEEFARTMYDLYTYLNAQVQTANSKKITEPIVNARKVLLPIRDAWAEMLTKKNSENINLSSISCNV